MKGYEGKEGDGLLSHQAIGCFVMQLGVPAVVFPQWSDQGTNAKMIDDVCRTWVRVKRREGDGVVEGKEIERCVKMAMEDEDMKKNTVNGGSWQEKLSTIADPLSTLWFD